MELTREIREKRIAVAKDVLKQLDRKGVVLDIVRHYGYLSGPISRASLGSGSLQPHVDRLQGACKVCMLGAAFLSFTRLYNGVSSDVAKGDHCIYVTSDDIRDALGGTFDELTLDLMESAFEACDTSEWEDGDRLDMCIRAGQYGATFTNAESSARAIATNIIENNGEFILPASASTEATSND